MKNHIGLTFLMISCFLLGSCSKSKNEGSVVCDEIILGQPFTATIGQAYCAPQSNWVMILGPVIEDSRCNVPEVDCIWEGQFIMGLTFEGAAEAIDTFYAINDWRDTLFNGPYTIMLNKVYPLTRTSFDPLDPSEYSFEMVVVQ